MIEMQGISRIYTREDGTPGSATWANQPNAAIVPADQDFGTSKKFHDVDSSWSVV